MKAMYSLALCGVAAMLAGCTTSSQVQELIDASHRDYLTKMEAHDASIDVLKKSAMTGLEKSKENAAILAEIKVQIDQLQMDVKIVKGYAEASKLMSAANTVKVNDLDVLLQANMEADKVTKEELMTLNRLYEGVMLSHYQMISDSANAAIESLKADGWQANSNAPVNLDEPIEIVAPDTSAAVSNVPPTE